MVNIKQLLGSGKLSRINELEIDRYLEFFSMSSYDNLEHCKFVLEKFPRWSIISGYYAMHDSAKLFLAKNFMLKVEYKVHATTIQTLKETLTDPELISMMQDGYSEFISLANDLATGKKERVKAQYYTGTKYMKKEYSGFAQGFLKNTVQPFLKKITALGDDK